MRIAERQRKYITFLEGRYTPILADRKIGINFLLDTAHCQPDDYLNEKVKDIVTVSKKPLESIEEESKSGEKDGMMPP